MKLLKNFPKYLLFVLILTINFSQTATFKKAESKNDIIKIWGDLFSKPQGENCAVAITTVDEQKKLETTEEDNNISWSGPRKKVNLYDKQQGYGASGYFFDYIDEFFQADISKEFQRIYDEVKKLTPDAKEYVDPYPLSKLVSAVSSGENIGKADAANEEALFKKLKSLTKDNSKIFNEKSYKNSITAANIFKACKDFQWNYNPNESNWAKKIIDKYDFDGDGRLNPREFILMTIIHNKNILGTSCKNCYNDIINKKIDPIFQYVDCNKDSKISAEDIWNNFKNLKRKNPEKSNLYSCRIKGKHYRTNSITDFVIKNMKSFDGYLNKDEFRAAILLGYWDRHTDAEKIYTDETKTFKKLRWGDNQDTDVVCDRINNANNPKAVQSGISIENKGSQKFFFRRR